MTAQARRKNTHNKPRKPNYAFIDNENVNISIQKQWWKIDRGKLIKRLKSEYNVGKAYMFMGYLETYQPMYNFFESLGYTLIFKPMNPNPKVPNKGNVDAELVLQAMIDYRAYYQAVVVSGDGDFACLMRYLHGRNKLAQVVVPNDKRYSDLIDEAAPGKITSLSPLRRKLSYRKPRKKKEEDKTSKSDNYDDKFYT